MAKIPEVSDYLIYQVKTCILNFKDRTQEVKSEEIRSFGYGCDFNGEAYFPDFTITMVVDRKTYFNIMEERDSMTMNLHITFKVQKPQKQDIGDKDRDRTWANDKFITYVDDHQYELMLKELEAADSVYRYQEDKSDKKADVAEHKEYTITLNLFREADINTAYHISNEIYTATDKQTLVTHLLNQAGAKNVLMSPFVNSSVKEAITLPITLMANLKYLATQYGLHSHGTMLFFDFDTTYILNKKYGCTAWRPGEYKKIVFVIRDDTHEKHFMGGSRLHEDLIGYINLDSHNIGILSYSDIDSVTRGGNMKIIDHWNNETKTITSSTKARKKHDRYIHNKYRNTLKEAELQQDMDNRGLVIRLKTYESNIHWLRPNKEFVFNFMNTQLEKALGGQYRILNLYVILTNQGEFFRPESSANFAKKP